MKSQTAIRLNLSDAVDDLAPEHPPCFYSRDIWLQYLKSAAAVQNQRDEQKVIAIVRGEPVFNVAYNFCEDCSAPRAARMQQEDRCNPHYLIQPSK